jgi:hypothetical protein
MLGAAMADENVVGTAVETIEAVVAACVEVWK